MIVMKIYEQNQICMIVFLFTFNIDVLQIFPLKKQQKLNMIKNHAFWEKTVFSFSYF